MNPVPHTGLPTLPAAQLTRRLELATLIHLGMFVVIASWGFGGNAAWSRKALAWWGTGGGAILLAALTSRTTRLAGQLRPWRWLWPFALLNVVVLASLFNPSFRVITMDHEELLAKTASLPNLPSSALPPLSLGSLWLFDGLYLSCFNLALLVRRRRVLRVLLLVAGANALLLAIFGSVQKLVHAPGLYFGLVRSPQSYFFASFIYHNHWGAFTVLMTAICLGLVAHYARNGVDHDFWHSPAFGGLVAVFFLAASIPLSTSRSCTLLVLALLTGAFLHWVVGTVRRRRDEHRSALRPVLGALVILLVAGGAAYKLAEPIIEQRLAKTREQIGQLRARGDFGGRQQLYRDTWRMARDKLWFGWGMASYPTVFYYYYNTQDSPVDRLPVLYYDAHSDWLQSLAELGIVGTSLVGLCGLVPLFSLRRCRAPGPLPRYLFAGCGLVLLYAWVEFPFGNPAVVLAWWLCFFAAVRYVRLDANAAES